MTFRPNQRQLAIILGLLAALLPAHEAWAQDSLLIQNITVISPENPSETPVLDVLVRNGRIEALAPAIELTGLGDVPGDVPRPFDALEPTYPVQDEAISQRYEAMFVKYQPEWFYRDEGWTGTTYADAVFFCATQGSSILCPYEALCPL